MKLSKSSILSFHKIKIITLSISLVILTIFDFLSIGSIPIFLSLVIDWETKTNFIFDYASNFDFLDKYLQLPFFEFIQNSLIIIFLLFFAKSILALFFHYNLEKLQLNIKNFFILELYKNYFSQSYKTYINTGSSKIIRNLTIEATNAAIYFSNIILLIKELIIFFIFFIFFLYSDPFITILIFFLIIILGIILYFLIVNKAKLFGIIFIQAKEKLINLLKDNFNSFVEIKIFNLFDSSFDSFKNVALKINNISFLIGLYKSLPKILIELILIVLILICLYFFLESKDSLFQIIPNLSLVALVIARLLPSFNVINSLLINLKFYEASLSHMITELNFLQKHLDRSKINMPVKNKNLQKFEINFKKVNFKFSNKIQILKNFSMRINKQDKIFIYGSSGSGKTTFINLFLGILKVYKGKIEFNGKNIQNNFKNWQSHLSYCSQSGFIIDDTIQKNIVLDNSSKNVDKIRLKKIYKILFIDDFISNLKNKDQTLIGEAGLKLSGGQKQRIRIARTLYHDRQILIFDEATNAIDKKLEIKIVKNILKFYKDRLIVFISHNRSLSKNFDKNLNFDKIKK
jgi:ABC-type multidrug transport system fused ATPase/permease subunit